MARPVTLFSGQWADLTVETMCRKTREFGYDGIELACWGDHIEVDKADQKYCDHRLEILKKHDLQLFTISTHLASQAVCDIPDQRHKGILPSYIWGDGDPEGIRQRAAREMIKTAEVAKRLGIKNVVGFTGSSIWPLLYSFPPVPGEMIAAGYKDFADRWGPIFDEYKRLGIRYCLEVHPTEIAFDIATSRRALEAVDYHPAFGFNYDPSHFGYQGVDYVKFIYEFADRIFHVHMKDVYWNDQAGDIGVFGGHTDFGDNRRSWNFRSIGRGKIDFERVIRALNDIGYDGPLSVEWEDSGMDREHGAMESCKYVKMKDFKPSAHAFDSVMKSE
jgi:sugar phosphate isomerase/epimerase